MKRFKIVSEQFVYSENEEYPKTISKEIECDEYKINKSYTIGDTHYMTKDYMSFIKDGEEAEKSFSLKDFNYILYEWIDEDWKSIDKYKRGI